jgi:hypothetical protein
MSHAMKRSITVPPDAVRLLPLLPEHHSRKIAASQEKRFFFEKKNQKTFARLG